MVTAAVPVFLTVTICASLVAPVIVAGKAMLVGVKVRAGAVAVTPVPVRATDAGVLVALPATTSVPIEVVAAVGLNSTETVQDAPAANVVPQVVADLRNGAEAVSEVNVTVTVPVFLTVTVIAAEVEPIVVDGKVRADGESEMVGPEPPVPPV